MSLWGSSEGQNGHRELVPLPLVWVDENGVRRLNQLKLLGSFICAQMWWLCQHPQDNHTRKNDGACETNARAQLAKVSSDRENIAVRSAAPAWCGQELMVLRHELSDQQSWRTTGAYTIEFGQGGQRGTRIEFGEGGQLLGAGAHQYVASEGR
jgi:hypothetical protein